MSALQGDGSAKREHLPGVPASPALQRPRNAEPQAAGACRRCASRDSIRQPSRGESASTAWWSRSPTSGRENRAPGGRRRRAAPGREATSTASRSTWCRCALPAAPSELSGGRAQAQRCVAALDVDEAQELRARAGVGAECAEHFAGDHGHAALVHAARRHALMNGVDDHADAARLEHLVDAGCDLRGELFLHLEAARIAVDHARQLADARPPGRVGR